MKLVRSDGTEIPLEDGEWIVGRVEQSDIVLHDPRVSRRHAHIIVEGEQCWVEDLESTNWTLVNDERVTEVQELKDWDKVTFADTSLIFRLAETSAAATDEPDTAKARQPVGMITERGIEAGVRQERAFTDEDDMGTRLEDVSHARAYWQQMEQSNPQAFIHYRFPDPEAAESALHDIPIIETAGDTGRPIAIQPVAYGVFDVGSGMTDLMLYGSALTSKLFEHAIQICEKYGGSEVNVRKVSTGRLSSRPTISGQQGRIPTEQQQARQGPPPDEQRKPPNMTQPASAVRPDLVKYVRTDKKPGAMGVEYTYHVYRGPNEASAKAFLEENPVDEMYVYIIVETKEGNFGRDIQGIFKE